MAKRGVNKVILIGNLGQDPEVRFMPDGKAVANFTIATSETWKDKQTGEQKEKTEWHRVSVMGKLAEIAGEYLKKGSKVYFEGKLQTRKWQNQQGQDQYTTEVLIDSFDGVMQMIDSKGDNSQAPMQQQPMQQSQQNNFNQPQQPPTQQQSPNYQQPQQQNGGFQQPPAQQQGGFKQQAAPQKTNPQEPSIDFDDDIPF